MNDLFCAVGMAVSVGGVAWLFLQIISAIRSNLRAIRINARNTARLESQMSTNDKWYRDELKELWQCNRERVFWEESNDKNMKTLLEDHKSRTCDPGPQCAEELVTKTNPYDNSCDPRKSRRK